MEQSLTKSQKRKAINWLTGAHFTNDIYSGFLNPIMPFLAAKLGFTMVAASIIMGIAQVSSSLTQPIFGFFADRINKRVFIFWGLVSGSLFVPLSTNTSNVYLLTIYVILGNLGGSVFHPQAFLFVNKFTDKEVLFNMSLFISAGTIGFAIGPMISSFIAQYFGFSYIQYLALIGILYAVTMFKYVPKISIFEDNRIPKNFKSAFKDILTNRYMLILIVIAIMKALISSSCAILMPFLWKDTGHNPAYIGTALSLFLFAGGIGSFTSSWFEKQFGSKFIFYCSMILSFPLMIIFIGTYQTHNIFSIITFLLMGYLTMFAQPVTMVMSQKVLPEYKSIVSGFINGFSWGVVAIILTFVSFMAEEFGIAKMLLVTSCIPVLFSYFIKFLPDLDEN